MSAASPKAASVQSEQPSYEALLSDAISALTAAGRRTWSGDRRDWAEFVTLALAGAAANLGSIESALAGRPGSWEADGVRNLLTSTVGHDEQSLFEHRTEPLVVDLYVDEILADADFDVYDQAYTELANRPAITEADLDAIAELEVQLEKQWVTDFLAYGAALKAAVEERAAKLQAPVPVVVNVDIETYRPDRPEDDWADVAFRLRESAIAATPLPDRTPPLERLAQQR